VLLGSHSAVGSSIYSGLSEQIAEYVAQAQPLLEKVRTAAIVSYEKTGNVSKTVFDNGVVLYVNYGVTAEQTELGTLEALSFRYR
jgi:chaperonin GroEL (HSP60 family)